ncbi:MAG TPA: hypothetical protein ENJ09_01320 [Planctomycetes bacterium]|nr:hypothetical protein [Planctomycetota bacterium]
MGLSHRFAIPVLALALPSLAPSCAPPPTEAEADTDGVVLFVVDTLRADHLGCYGYSRATSPNLDAFAAEGIVFEGCRSQSTWTKPSTASILTGLYPSEHGADKEGAAMREAVTSLAERLSAVGIRTGSFFANTWLKEKQGLQQGFGVSEFIPKETPDRTRELVRRALEFVRSCDGDPFFLYLHSVDPHAPYDPPEPFRSEFDSGAAARVADFPGLDGKTIDVAAMRQGGLEYYTDLYDGEIRVADEAFGMLLDGLEELGRASTCAVFFLADHGEEFGEHGGWHHGPTMYDEVLRIPLVYREPGVEFSGRRVAGLAMQVDLAPTVLRIFGLPRPPELPGRDLLELVGASGAPPRFGISEVDSAGVSRRAVLGDGLKYIRAWAPSEEEFLFDLRADPGETTNLIESEPARADAHRRALASFLERTDRGLFVLFQNGGAEALNVEVLLFHGEDPADDPQVQGLYTEEMGGGGRYRDGFPEVHEGEWKGRQRRGTRVLLNVEPGDGDGIHVLPRSGGPEAENGPRSMELVVLVAGSPIDPAWVRLGPGEGSPATLPLEIRLPLDPALCSPPFPARSDLGGDPMRLRIWAGAQIASREVEFSAEEIEDLRALGYMGGE